MKQEKQEKQDVPTAAKFPLGVLLQAKKFTNRKDALQVVVKDGEEITIKEADARLDTFMKGKVK